MAKDKTKNRRRLGKIENYKRKKKIVKKNYDLEYQLISSETGIDEDGKYIDKSESLYNTLGSVLDPKANLSYIENRMSIIEDIMKLFPDIELAAEIRATLISNPTEISETKLTVSNNSKKIPPHIISGINEVVSTEVERVYKLNKDIYDNVYACVAGKGGFAYLVIKSKVVTDIIGSGEVELTKETLKDVLIRNNIIESSVNSLISITDKPDVLNIYNDIETTGEMIGGNATAEEISIASMFNNLQYDVERELYISDTTDDGKGRPLFKAIPVEAITVIHKKGLPSKHLLYALAIDENGEPLTITSTKTVTEDVAPPNQLQAQHINEGGGNNIDTDIKNAAAAMNISGSIAPTANVDHKVLSKIIDDFIVNKLSSVDYEFSKDTIDMDILDTMLSRTLAGKKTTLVILKPENLIYGALMHRNNGTGKSRIEDLFYLTTMRAANLVANVHGSILENIPFEKHSITIDDENQDPEKTAKVMAEYILKSNSGKFLSGFSSVSSISQWLSRLGISINVKGAGLPDHDISTEINNRPRANVDSEQDDQLKKLSLAKFGVTPTQIDDSLSSDFAVGIILRNGLQLSRVLKDQVKMNTAYTHLLQSIVKFDPILRDMIDENLKDTVKAMRKTDIGKKLSKARLTKFVRYEYINNLTFTLPRPINSQEIERMRNEIADYKDMVADFLDTVIPDDTILEDLAGSLGTKADHIRSIITSMLMQRKVKNSGYLDDIFAAFSPKTEEAGTDAFEDFRVFMGDLSERFAEFYKDIKRDTKKSSTKVEKVDDGEDEEEPEDTEETGNDEVEEEEVEGEEEPMDGEEEPMDGEEE